MFILIYVFILRKMYVRLTKHPEVTSCCFLSDLSDNRDSLCGLPKYHLCLQLLSFAFAGTHLV